EDYSPSMGKWMRAAIYPSADGLTVYFHDLSAEREAEERAYKSEEDYRLFLDRITDGFIVLDKDFRYRYVNKQIGDLVGRDPASLIGKNIWEEFPDAVDSLTFKAFRTAFNEQRFISNIDYYEPLNLWQENYIYPSPEGLSIFIKDISARKKLEKEMQALERAQQFEIMVTSLEAQEKERNHLGRELHDNVNQLLVATRLTLSLMKDDAKKFSPDFIQKCIDNLEKAIRENRRISHDLVTPELSDGDLVDELRELLFTMLLSNGIEAKMDTASFNEFNLEHQKKIALYRIAQEQCTNIVKYAKAKTVTLSLLSNEDAFTMIISDDGVGTDNESTDGIGLRNINARARFFGGSSRVRTGKGYGFTLEVTIPAMAIA
ncbi:MAG TPA: histidine kinase, partial [Flavisolibacter sp.]|nr:histidine kinase [Flavisolibacter sp.]